MSPNPVDSSNLITAVLVGCVFVGLVVYFIFQFTKGEAAQRDWLKKYTDRKQKYWEGMNERQRKRHIEMRGASEMEQYASLEARIYELEQIIRNQQDDGK
jgi:hypothetical protein